jgi:hypothetical protein
VPLVDARHFDLTPVDDAYELQKSRQAQGKVVIDITN